MSQVRMDNAQSRMISIYEAARYFSVSEKTVHRWIDAGQLDAHQLGRQWRIAPEEVERFLATRRIWQRRLVGYRPHMSK